MTTLVPIDGTQASLDAARFAASSRPDSDLLLLYVAPSARPVDLARGKFLLESMARKCQGVSEDVNILTRLEVGEKGTKLSEVAEEADCDLIVVGAPASHASPGRRRVEEDEVEWTGAVRRPLVFVLPTGESVAAGGAHYDDDERPEALAGRAA